MSGSITYDTVSVANVSAAFFVDTDLTVAPPTAIYMEFRDEQGFFFIGTVRAIPSGVFDGASSIADRTLARPASAFGNLAVTPPTPMTPVPEPASLLFVGSGLLGLVARRRMSKKR